MEGAKLTIDQKKELEGKEFKPDSFFNPIQDIHEDWYITKEEVETCENEDLKWVNELPIVEFEPKPSVIIKL